MSSKAFKNNSHQSLSDDEFFAQIDAVKSSKTKESIKKHAGQTADDLFNITMKKAEIQS